jgi:hypothetical protein
MYRIEFEPGDVGVFRSVEEVATAIKSGVITPRARIYHQATDKWLPIEFHPHYRKALDLVASGNIPSSAPSSSVRVGHTPFTPPGARAAVQVAPPAPVVVEPPKAEPPTINHVELEPPAPQQFESEPGGESEPAEPDPVEAGPVVTASTPRVIEPAVVEPEPAPSPPAFVYTPRSREIRFVPLDEPKPLGRSRLTAWDQFSPSTPTPPAAEFHAVAPPAIEIHVEHVAPSILFRESDPNNGFSASTEGMDSLALAPDASGRPIFRPRLRLPGIANLRRPVLIAVGGLVLIISAHFGLTAASHTLNAGVMTSGWTGFPFLGRESAAAPAGRLNLAQAGGRLPHATEAQGSPSFGASSAFPSPARAGSPTDAKRQALGGNPATLSSEKREQPAAPDSIVQAAPLARIAVAAPKIGGLPGATNGKLTPAVLVSHYDAAYAAARAELETGFRTAGFANVFATEHLSSAAGLRAARLSAGTASAYVAKYRRREAEIEAAFADSAAELAKTPEDKKIWESRKVLQESPEVAKLAGFLLDEIDSVLGVLASQDGAYEIKDGAIVFQDATAAKAYSELRPWLERHAHQWADTAAGTPTSAARVLRAIGSTRLPEGGAF